ncbi:CUB domain-containing protein [Caerostris darwini]|uniref:CUB domain-containing protein n=1 Tax=Caerostris darwini TaxID=1538125 RepID=A0AAV4UC01_9ARAC|nr:CUB domain-containing protein [Caerostris darwini]
MIQLIQYWLRLDLLLYAHFERTPILIHIVRQVAPSRILHPTSSKAMKLLSDLQMFLCPSRVGMGHFDSIRFSNRKERRFSLILLFLRNVVTGDEIWCLEYDLETKRQSTKWTYLERNLLMKVRTSKSETTMMITSFYSRGIIHREFHREDSSTTGVFYKGVMDWLWKRIQQVRPNLLDSGFVQETFCWNQDFRLDCNWNSVLAFHEAYFTNDEAQVNRSACSDMRDGREPCVEDIRASINKRCSGMSHCHYNFTEDHPERECRCKGVIYLRYSCIPESNINKFCNIKITGTSGYISSPGYPRFYPKVSNCTWSIESSVGQEMKLVVLDMDLRPGIQTRGKELCPDSLVILENNHRVLYTCGQADDKTRIPIQSTGGHLQVAFKSNEFLPSRGFLLYYKSVKEALSYRSNNTDDSDTLHEGDVVEVYLKKYKYIEEILIPAACVVGLVFGNVAIILLIQKIRKQRKSSSSHHNGRSSSVPPSGSSNTQVPQTLHVPTTVSTDTAIPSITRKEAPPIPPKPIIHPLPIVRQAPRVLMTDL